MNDSPDPPGTRFVTFSIADLPPGRVDRTRMGKRNPLNTELRPPIPHEDIDATRAELAELRRRRTAKSG